MNSAYRGSIFNGFARFAKVPIPEHAVCLALAPSRAPSPPLPPPTTLPAIQYERENLTTSQFDNHIIALFSRVLADLGEQDELTHRVVKRIRDTLLLPPHKRQALPYFCSPRYSVETNFYQVEGSDITIVACLPGVVPEIILYPFGGDILPGLEQSQFELTLTDSEGKTGVAQAELQIRDDEIAFITFTGFCAIEATGHRTPVPLREFVLPITFSGRYHRE